MAKDWFDKRDMEKRFGWSFRQLKTRLTYLDPVIAKHCQGGNGQAIQVDNEGLTILERQHELEGDGYSVKAGSRQVIDELENQDSEGTQEDVKVHQGRVKVLETKVKELERYVQFLENQVEQKDNQIQQLLPGSTNGKGILRRIWARIW